MTLWLKKADRINNGKLNAANDNALAGASYKGKLLFSSFLLKGSTIFEYEGKKDKANIEQSFLRTGLQEGKHIKKADRINVEEPFFEYVTPHKQGEAKFMLTKEEQEFINQ